MIIPQILIMFYYGEHYHIGLALLAFIFIPAILLLSNSIYTSRLSTIKSHNELEKSIEELHTLSITDNLTNIYNRRYFFDVAQKLISIAQREQTRISLLMLDIDYFKSINDTYGHQAGDFILVSMATDINKLIRESDIFARIGGEEFTILLHDTSIDGALTIAEKIRQKIHNKQYIYNDFIISITVSIGVTELGEEIDSIEELYKEADKRLYKAKEAGRDRVY